MTIGNKLNDSTKDIVNRLVKMGNEIGNHSWDHSHMSTLTASEIKSSITATNDVLKESP